MCGYNKRGINPSTSFELSELCFELKDGLLSYSRENIDYRFIDSDPMKVLYVEPDLGYSGRVFILDSLSCGKHTILETVVDEEWILDIFVPTADYNRAEKELAPGILFDAGVRRAMIGKERHRHQLLRDVLNYTKQSSRKVLSECARIRMGHSNPFVDFRRLHFTHPYFSNKS